MKRMVRSKFRRPKRRGYVLIAVLAVIAVLVTIVAILQYQGMARRRNAVLMEAQYLARRAFDAALQPMVRTLRYGADLYPAQETLAVDWF